MFIFLLAFFLIFPPHLSFSFGTDKHSFSVVRMLSFIHFFAADCVYMLSVVIKGEETMKLFFSLLAVAYDSRMLC